MAGRGRGVNILPAWMTSQDAVIGSSSEIEVAIDASNAEDAPLSDLPPSKISRREEDETLSIVSSGRGRGVSILPAWMTNGGNVDLGGEAAAEENELPIRESVPPLSGNNGDSGDCEAKFLPSATATGRGRGISVLPAWMTMTAAGGSGPSLGSSLSIEAETSKFNEGAILNYLDSCLSEAAPIKSEDNSSDLGIGSKRKSVSAAPAAATSAETSQDANEFVREFLDALIHHGHSALSAAEISLLSSRGGVLHAALSYFLSNGGMRSMVMAELERLLALILRK